MVGNISSVAAEVASDIIRRQAWVITGARCVHDPSHPRVSVCAHETPEKSMSQDMQCSVCKQVWHMCVVRVRVSSCRHTH